MRNLFAGALLLCMAAAGNAFEAYVAPDAYCVSTHSYVAVTTAAAVVLDLSAVTGRFVDITFYNLASSTWCWLTMDGTSTTLTTTGMPIPPPEFQGSQGLTITTWPKGGKFYLQFPAAYPTANIRYVYRRKNNW